MAASALALHPPLKRQLGGRGWLGLVVYVTLWDAWAAFSRNETLSMAFYRSLRHPRHRLGTITLWAYITAHLFHAIPDDYDPLRRLARKVLR